MSIDTNEFKILENALPYGITSRAFPANTTLFQHQIQP